MTGAATTGPATTGTATVGTAPAPRRRDATRTRDAILLAGRAMFAHKGYLATGLREIAAEAGINVALVRRYFGSKEGLFRAALESVLFVEPLIEGDRARFGERVVALLLEAEVIPNPVAMMLFATADPDARALCVDVLERKVMRPLALWLGGADAEARAARLHMLWVGFIASRRILPRHPPEAGRAGATSLWMMRMTQQIADGGSDPVGAVEAGAVEAGAIGAGASRPEERGPGGRPRARPARVRGPDRDAASGET